MNKLPEQTTMTNLVIEEQEKEVHWIVWVGDTPDYYVYYEDAERDYFDWIDNGYDDVIIEEITND
jgi:hypothetical protein